MNTIKCITYRIILFVLCVSFSMSAVANESTAFVDAEIKQRVQSMSSSIDLVYNAEVKRRIKQYTINQRSASEVLLGRISIYFPLIESKLRERGMPDDLKYLAVIESGLIPHAKSRVGAAGLWQFMKPTARMYDMKINSVIDERRDPEISTDAALDYLQYLYDRFGDWALAMAAYNCGPGNMNKAIRKANSKDFWKISKYLPRETREYVPKFIAMSYLMNYYYSHGLSPQMPSNEVLNTATSKVTKEITFKDLSKKYNINMNTLRLLNPTYIRNYIPRGEYKLTLPTDHMMAFLAGTQEEQPQILYSHINGKKRLINQLRGQITLEPIPAYTQKYITEHTFTIDRPIRIAQVVLAPDAYTSRDRKYTYHTLRARESLLDVAQQHNMNIVELMEINSFTSHNLPEIGDPILVNPEG